MWVKGEIFRNLDDATISARGTLDRHAQASLFDRLDWFRRTLEFAAPSGQPLIVRARSDGADCWLFLMTSQGRATALASWYTLSFRPVFTGEPDDATKTALLVATARRLKKHVAALELAPVPESDAEMLTAAFDRARWVATAHATTINWTIATEGLRFEDYWAQRPGELRSTVRRKREKFDIRTEILNDFDGVAWDHYEQIYNASWKPEEGAPAFLRDLALAEGRAGALRLGIATHEGAPVAAQFWTVENGRAIIHKLAHLESAAEMSPGSILTAAMFEHVLDHDGVDVVDFGTGDDRYKRDWMDTRAPLMRVRLYNPLRLAGVAGALREGARVLVGRRPAV